MTVPALAKTWQFDLNQVIRWIDFNTVNQNLLFAIKESLKGFPLMPWVVKGSSNSVAAGMDNVDRWLSRTNLVSAAAGSAHSWIVLEQAGLNAGFQVCIDMRFNGGGTVAVSPSAGFTGGTTTNRPTATDEYTCTLVNAADASWGVTNLGAILNHNLHVMQSTDGQCTRIFVTVGNVDNAGTSFGNPPITTLFASFDKLRNPVTGFTIPVVSSWAGTTSAAEVMDYAALFSTSVNAENFRSRHSGTNMRVNLSWDHTWNIFNFLAWGPNTFTSEAAMMSLGAYVPNTATRRGRHGEFFDMWVAPRFPLPSFVFPDAVTPAFVKVGSLVLPWDGVSPTVFV